MTRTLESYFTDWEAHVFGYGYGTGEEHTIRALKIFMGAIGLGRDESNAYDFRYLQGVVGPAIAWLLINILCHADVIEYGTSPRFGWLTPKGERLKAFIDSKSFEELTDLAGADAPHCWPGGCNCGPDGYEEGRVCDNPFYRDDL